MLQSSTITFLRQLKEHNERPWFEEHKDQYLEAKADFEELIQQILEKYSKTDPDIASLKVKDCVFRIYRDVRFSKNKTPYKTHLAAGINKGGKKVHFPGYYLHVEPGGNSYMGGGIWRPSKDILKKIRQEIDYNYEDFLGIIEKGAFQKTFGALSEDDRLVRPPQGYDPDNPAIDYLKNKSFIAECSLTDKSLTEPDMVKNILALFKKLKLFIDFLERAMDE